MHEGSGQTATAAGNSCKAFCHSRSSDAGGAGTGACTGTSASVGRRTRRRSAGSVCICCSRDQRQDTGTGSECENSSSGSSGSSRSSRTGKVPQVRSRALFVSPAPITLPPLFLSPPHLTSKLTSFTLSHVSRSILRLLQPHTLGGVSSFFDTMKRLVLYQGVHRQRRCSCGAERECTSARRTRQRNFLRRQSFLTHFHVYSGTSICSAEGEAAASADAACISAAMTAASIASISAAHIRGLRQF